MCVVGTCISLVIYLCEVQRRFGSIYSMLLLLVRSCNHDILASNVYLTLITIYNIVNLECTCHAGDCLLLKKQGTTPLVYASLLCSNLCNLNRSMFYQSYTMLPGCWLCVMCGSGSVWCLV